MTVKTNFFWLRFKYLVDVINLVVQPQIEAIDLIVVGQHLNLLLLSIFEYLILLVFEGSDIGLIIPHFVDVALLYEFFLLLVDFEILNHHEVVQVAHDAGVLDLLRRLLLLRFDVSSADILLHLFDTVLLLYNNRLSNIKSIIDWFNIETINLVPLLLGEDLSGLSIKALAEVADGLFLLLGLLGLLRILFDLEGFEYLDDLFLPHQTLIPWLQHKSGTLLAGTIVVRYYLLVGQLVLNFVEGNVHTLWLLMLLLLVVVMTLSFGRD